jgi:hypothetical protein
MADWYVSSAAYAAVTPYTISTAYTVGQFIKPSSPTLKLQWVMRCTTAGTSAATEPAWPAANNGTVTSGGAVFTNVTGQSTYGWSAAAGDMPTLIGGGGGAVRFLGGDRMFVSSDHSETQTASATYGSGIGTQSYNLALVLSVNRAGSVPPVAADLLPGATATVGTGGVTLTIELGFPVYFYGMNFANTGSAIAGIQLTSTQSKMGRFDTCVFYLSSATANQRFQAGSITNIIFDNTSVYFTGSSQGIVLTNDWELIWINTPSPILGTVVPAALFIPVTLTLAGLVVLRGLDLSALTTTLMAGGSGNSAGFKLLVDSCRIAPGVSRAVIALANNSRDDNELVNCFDGTNIINERWQSAGAVTTDFAVTLSGGAVDNAGAFSHKMVSTSGTNLDKIANMLLGFWMDVNYTTLGSSKTATVEISSNLTLNNDDISLELEYLGTSGSSLATIVNTLPATPLTAATAIATSTATWVSSLPPGIWNTLDMTGITLSGGDLTATATGAGGVRNTSSMSTTGKYYFEFTLNTYASGNSAVGVASPSAILASVGPTPLQASVMYRTGAIWTNNASTGFSLGTRANGDVIGVAVDIAAHLIWFRVAPSGLWNGSGTGNPATGVAGLTLTALGATVLACFGASVSGESVTANFGATTTVGTVPAGFTTVLPLGTVPITKQKLQATFTPQQAGRVRGRLRLGRVNTTVYYDPRLVIT